MYRSVTASFYRGACGVFLVFALNDRKSFERLNFWYDEFQEHGSPHAIIVLIGTKSDQIRNIATEEGLSMMKKMGGMFYVETSAETGLQI
jgi:GTPase SAR1 family protein